MSIFDNERVEVRLTKGSGIFAFVRNKTSKTIRLYFERDCIDLELEIPGNEKLDLLCNEEDREIAKMIQNHQFILMAA